MSLACCTHPRIRCSADSQCKLFQSIKPLFTNKPVLLVINKIDIIRLSDLSPENRAYVETITSDPSITVVEASTYSEEGVMNVRNTACDLLLAHRVEQKMRGTRIEAIANKIHVAMPQKRDDVERAPFIPDAVKGRVKYDKMDPERRVLEKDVEQGMMGGEIFSMDTKSMCIHMIGWLNSKSRRNREGRIGFCLGPHGI